MYDPTSQDFYSNFVWYLTHEDQLALEERDNHRARAVRDTYADLLPVSRMTESQMLRFNEACAAYREEAENAAHLTTTD